MSDLEGNEVFEADCLGTAEEVSQERICDDELILIKGGKASWTKFEFGAVYYQVPFLLCDIPKMLQLSFYEKRVGTYSQ